MGCDGFVAGNCILVFGDRCYIIFRQAAFQDIAVVVLTEQRGPLHCADIYSKVMFPGSTVQIHHQLWAVFQCELGDEIFINTLVVKIGITTIQFSYSQTVSGRDFIEQVCHRAGKFVRRLDFFMPDMANCMWSRNQERQGAGKIFIRNDFSGVVHSVCFYKMDAFYGEGLFAHVGSD